MNDLAMIRGDTNEFELTLTDNAGDPFDLTDADITMTVGDLFTKTIGSGITVSAPLTGVASIVVGPEDTEGAPDVRVAYSYDVQVTLADGRIKTPVRGRFVVVPDVTTD